MRSVAFQSVLTRVYAVLFFAFFIVPVQADVTRVSHWLDRIVVTDDGELLGSVQDLAVNQQTYEIDYIVVSVGSYLVDDNLIAVAPDTFQVSDDNLLMIEKDALAKAPRFNDDTWPREAQVKPMPKATPTPRASENSAKPAAEISSARRKLVLGEDGETSVVELRRASASSNAPALAADIAPKTLRDGIFQEQPDDTFARFDTDADGYLNRRELGPHMQPNMKFGDFDLDANGGIDSFEFRVLQESR